MLGWFTGRARQNASAQEVYGSIVALARQPAIYAELGVPDSVQGRLEVLMIHMFIYLERLRGEDEDCQTLAQNLVDAFFADMDAAARELGTGDMAVPKKMRGLAGIFRDRLAEYELAVADRQSGKLAEAIESNMLARASPPSRQARKLASYVNRARKELRAMPLNDLRAGKPPRSVMVANTG